MAENDMMLDSMMTIVVVVIMAGMLQSILPKPPATLVSIAVTPNPTADLAVGATKQFMAIGAYSDSTTKDITALVTWTCDIPTYMSISSVGLATGIAIGTANITAALSGIMSIPVSLTIISLPTLVSIEVTPSIPASIAKLATQQFMAIGTYTDNSTEDITATVIWSSSDIRIVSISAIGVATGISGGTVEITAALSDVTSVPISLTVTVPVTLSSIAVTPAAHPGINVGDTIQFTAMGTYSNGSTANITSTVNWVSSDIRVVRVSTTGLATSLSSGTVSITANLSSVSSTPISVTVTVTVTLSSIAVTPPTPLDIHIGDTVQFTATGTYSDGSTAVITDSVQWVSSDTVITLFSTSTKGLLTASTLGMVSISASLQGIISPYVFLSVVQAVQVSLLTYSDPIASNGFYDPSITAWACVSYQVTIKNNTNQSVTIFYNIHFKAYNTITKIPRYEGTLVGNNPTNGVSDSRFPAVKFTIPAHSIATKTFNLSPYQVQLQIGDTMELSFIDFRNGYTANLISNPNGDGFSGDSVEAPGTETPVAKTSL